MGLRSGLGISSSNRFPGTAAAVCQDHTLRRQDRRHLSLSLLELVHTHGKDIRIQRKDLVLKNHFSLCTVSLKHTPVLSHRQSSSFVNSFSPHSEAKCHGAGEVNIFQEKWWFSRGLFGGIGVSWRKHWNSAPLTHLLSNPYSATFSSQNFSQSEILLFSVLYFYWISTLVEYKHLKGKDCFFCVYYYVLEPESALNASFTSAEGTNEPKGTSTPLPHCVFQNLVLSLIL